MYVSSKELIVNASLGFVNGYKYERILLQYGIDDFEQIILHLLIYPFDDT